MAVKFRIRLLLAVIIFSLVNTGCTKSMVQKDGLLWINTISLETMV